MSVLRKNTLVVDFSVLPKRPDAEKVQQFLEKKVQLQLADTKNIQLHNIKNCVYIETVDSETALRYEKANHNRHTIVCGNKEFKIPVYVESEAVTVRVHDLPPHTLHMTIIDFMRQYGVVMSITRERWKHYFPGIYNGVRVLRMQLDRPIPSFVTIDGETTLVTYRNQPKTCRHCGNSAHPKEKCSKAPKKATTTQTPPTPAPVESDQQLDANDFPALSLTVDGEESNQELGSTLTHKQQNKTTSENGNDGTRGNDDNEGNDGDDSSEESSSSDTNDFSEVTNQKRRMSKNQKENEIKKMCLSQGSQNNNRFQGLIEIDTFCPSAAELEEYLNRSKNRSNKNNNSS